MILSGDPMISSGELSPQQVLKRGHYGTYEKSTVDEEKEHGDGEVASSSSIFIIGTCSKNSVDTPD